MVTSRQSYVFVLVLSKATYRFNLDFCVNSYQKHISLVMKLVNKGILFRADLFRSKPIFIILESCIFFTLI